jgi:hypothetical protein
VAFVTSWYFGILPSNLTLSNAQQENTKKTISVEEKLTQLVENSPYENPLVPVYFHYLDRYFNGLSQDAFDRAVAGVMDNLKQTDKDAVAILLKSYKQNKDILDPIIGDFNLELSDTVNPNNFATALQSDLLSMDLHMHVERPGFVRLPPGEEFGPRVYIQYVNNYWDRTQAVPIRPGESVTLQGFNFYDLNLKVTIENDVFRRELSGDQVFIEGDSTVAADDYASQVRDMIYFHLPNDIPPGYYWLSVHNLSPLGVDDSRNILVPPPSDEKYIVRALTVYCEDETNGFLGSEAGSDETFFSFIVYTGDALWAVVTDDYEYDDQTSRNLGVGESTIFGPEQGFYADVDTQLRIMVSGYEIDSGDVEQAKRIANVTIELAKAFLTVMGQANWALVANAVGQLTDVIIGLADGEVMVADDEIKWTEDDLYFLTAEPRPQSHTLLNVERQRHLGYTEKEINIRGYDLSVFSYMMPSGIEVRIPTDGTFKFYILPEYGQRSFAFWRGYKNSNEPSQYFVHFEVQRQAHT